MIPADKYWDAKDNEKTDLEYTQQYGAPYGMFRTFLFRESASSAVRATAVGNSGCSGHGAGHHSVASAARFARAEQADRSAGAR